MTKLERNAANRAASAVLAHWLDMKTNGNVDVVDLSFELNAAIAHARRLVRDNGKSPAAMNAPSAPISPIGL